MRNTIFCNHYRAMSSHTTCSAGVEYDKFKGDARPCFCKPGCDAPPGCELAQFPTAEELAAEEAEMNERLAKIGAARKAIVDVNRSAPVAPQAGQSIVRLVEARGSVAWAARPERFGRSNIGSVMC